MSLFDDIKNGKYERKQATSNTSSSKVEKANSVTSTLSNIQSGKYERVQPETIADKMNQLWVEDTPQNNNTTSYKATSVKDFVNSINKELPQPTAKTPALPTNNTYKPVNVKDFVDSINNKAVVEAGYDPNNFTLEEKALLNSGNYSVNPNYDPKNKYSKKVIYTGNVLTNKDVNPTLGQKLSNTAERTGRTAMDFVGNVATGVTQAGEGLVDAGVANTGDFLSNLTSVGGLLPNKVSEGIRQGSENFVKYGLASDMKKMIDEDSKKGSGIYKPSILGIDVRDIAQEGARMITLSPLGMAGFMASAAGSSTEEALNEGEKLRNAVTYGNIAGAIEGATEKMFDTFGIIGGGKFDKLLPKSVMGRFIAGGIGEGIEEGVSGAINPFVKMLTYEGKVENPFGSKENFNNYLGDLGQQMLAGMVTGWVMQGTSDISSSDIRNQFRSEVSKAVNKLPVESNVKSNIADKILGGANRLTNAQIDNGIKAYKSYINEYMTKNINSTIQNQNVQGLPKSSLREKLQSVQNNVGNEITSTKIQTPQNANMNVETQNAVKQQIASTINNNSQLTAEEKQSLLQILEENSNNLTPDAVNFFNDTINNLQNNRLEQVTTTEDKKATYKKYLNDKTELDKTALDTAINSVPANKSGRRTKEQWLKVANTIGQQIYDLSDSEIERYAYKSWQETHPNQSGNLNRQGKGFVKFTSDEWIDAITKSAQQAKAQTQVSQVNNVLPTERSQATLESAKQAGMTDIDVKEANDLNNLLRSGAKLVFYDENNIPEVITGSKDIKRARDGNGFYYNGTVYVNKNSPKKVQQILGHELTHHTENSSIYNDMAKYIKNSNAFYEYISSKGYNSIEEYKADLKERGYSNKDFDREMVAEFCENNLFNTQESIDRLARENRTLAQKIKNWISDMLANFKGTTVEKELRKIESMYNKALNETANNNIESSNISMSIETIPNTNKKYVKADRQVISGDDVSLWGKQVENYINEKIRNNQDVNVLAEDGTLLTITEDTAGKAKFRNEVKMADGNTRYLTDGELLAKLRAETHIDELAEISKKVGEAPDYKKHNFAKDGFEYRNAYFEDIDGKYYRITMSVGKNGAINTIYNIGLMKNTKKNRSNSSLLAQRPNGNTSAVEELTSNNNIQQNNKSVNTEYAQENKKDTAGDKPAFSMPSTDNQDGEITKELKDYFKDAKIYNDILFDNYEGKLSKNEMNDIIKRYEEFRGNHLSDFDNSNQDNINSSYYYIDNSWVKISTTQENQKLYIDELYVEKPKKGIGTKVVNILKDYANNNNLLLDTSNELKIANGFWDKVLRNNIISNTDNTSPTSNEDIRFSISDNQNDILNKLNEDSDLYDKIIWDNYDKIDEISKKRKAIQESEEFKNAIKKIMSIDDVEKAMKTKEYKLLEEAQKLEEQEREYREEISVAQKEIERITKQIEEEEKAHRDPAKAIKQAKKYFGTTSNFKEAGYLLQSGELLDFSGKNQGGPAGRRSLDHRDINEFGYDMEEFIDMGNIRLQPESNGFQLMQEPTDKQYDMLKKYIDNASGDVFVDIYKNDKMHEYDSKEYPKNTSSSKIIDDLRHYFKHGSFPYESDLQKFRAQFSLPNKPTTDSKGRTLSKQQQEYFKDSKVRDEEGNLLAMYHGTPNGTYTVFKDGSYFSPRKEYADGYKNTWASAISTKQEASNPKTYEVYLNITNPFTIQDSKAKNIYINEFIKGGNSLSYDPYTNWTEDINQLDEIDWTEAEDLREWLQENHPEYDGLILDEGGDGGYGEAEYRWRGKSFVPFSANQIKNVDNTNPTANEDIRYSIKDDMDKLNEEYGSIKPGENPARDVKIPKKTGKNQYVSQYARTLAESEVTTPETLNLIEKDVVEGRLSHEKVTDKKALAWAENYIKENGWEDSIKDWDSWIKGGSQLDKDHLALGQLIYNNAVQAKDAPRVMKMIGDLVAEFSETGRSLQAARLLKRMTPDGRLYSLERSVAKINKELLERSDKAATQVAKDGGIKIPDELAQKLLEATDSKAVDKAVADIQQYIADQVPPTWMDKMNAWRYLAMLGNPRTHIRNIAGNALMVPAKNLKNEIGTVLERTLPKEQRTKAILNPLSAADNALKSFAANDFDQNAETVRGENKYDIRAGIQEKQKIFNTKPLENLRKANFNALEAEDAFFLKMHYTEAFAEALKARGITVEEARNNTAEMNAKLSEIRDVAINEAQKATYRDFNTAAQFISKTKNAAKLKALNAETVGGKAAWGATNLALEGLVPFAKTPANIVRRGIEYSPLGLATGIYDAVVNVKKGKLTAAQAIDKISAGLSGTALVGLGMLLAKLGLVSGGDNEDKKERYFEEMTGLQSYALNLGKYNYTIDWSAPASMPLFVGVELWNAMQKENADFEEVLTALGKINEPVFELSMLQGVNSTISSASYGNNPILSMVSNMSKSYASQYNPTVLGQVARTIDDTRRTTYEDKNKSFSKLRKFGQQQLQKIPFANQTLLPRYDKFGRKDVDTNVLRRAFENFISPGYISEDKSTPVENELSRVYKQTGEKGVLPSYAAKNVTVNGEKINFSQKQYEEFTVARGQTAYEQLSKMFETNQYQKLSDKDKQELIEDVYTYANEYAKSKVTDFEFSKTSKNGKVNTAAQHGINPYQYLMTLQTADTDNNGYVSQKEFESAVKKSNLTAQQRAYLIGLNKTKK